jgi:hypothetical protein
MEKDDQAMGREELEATLVYARQYGGTGLDEPFERISATDAALREELRLWRDAHVGGCPTIADDTGDEVLADCGVCTCVPMLTQLSTLREELASYKEAVSQLHRDTAVQATTIDRLREELAQVKKG